MFYIDLLWKHECFKVYLCWEWKKHIYLSTIEYFLQESDYLGVVFHFYDHEGSTSIDDKSETDEERLAQMAKEKWVADVVCTLKVFQAPCLTWHVPLFITSYLYKTIYKKVCLVCCSKLAFTMIKIGQ